MHLALVPHTGSPTETAKPPPATRGTECARGDNDPWAQAKETIC